MMAKAAGLLRTALKAVALIIAATLVFGLYFGANELVWRGLSYVAINFNGWPRLGVSMFIEWVILVGVLFYLRWKKGDEEVDMTDHAQKRRYPIGVDPRKEKRQVAAIERQERYDALTKDEKMAQIRKRPGTSKRERERLG